MVFTLQARWILVFSFVGTTFLIKSSLSRMIHSIWLRTKFGVLDIPAKILAFRSCHTWYTVAAKLSLREKLTKLLPCQETVAHRIHSSQPFVILGMSHLSDIKNKKMDANTEKLKGTLKKQKQPKDITLYRSLALIPTDANHVITWSRNPQSRLRSDPGKSK
jgi:hypothetical protein